MDELTKLPEAGATAWTTFKREDGFEVSLTIRDVDGRTTLERLDAAITVIKRLGGIPIPLRGGYQKGTQRPIEYVQGRVCPLDGARLIHTQKKDGTKYVKCENNKWDAQQNRATGCTFIEWQQNYQQPPPPRQTNQEDYGY